MLYMAVCCAHNNNVYKQNLTGAAIKVKGAIVGQNLYIHVANLTMWETDKNTEVRTSLDQIVCARQ